jgi:hypothetical protein
MTNTNQAAAPPLWKDNEGARERVAQLLEDSGALAESRVSAVCHQFVSKTNNKRGVHVESDSLTYGLDSELSPLRQIDQRTNLYKEFSLDDRGGVILNLQIAIEVKHRKDLQVFGIEYPKHSYRPRMPMVGFLHGAEIFREIVTNAPFMSTPLLQPVLLEIQGGTTPRKVYEENLIYNAAGSIYDFVRFDLTGDPGDSDELPYGAEIIESMKLMEKFDKYLKETRYAWWSIIRDWMSENFTGEIIEEYNRLLGAHRLYQGIYLYCPVLCIDVPMWRYEGQTFHQLDSMLTRTRVNHWPGSFRQKLAGYTTEAPLLVTNVSGLSSVLSEASRWFYRVENLIKRSGKDAKARWFIESNFYQMAVRKGFSDEPQSWVRSDVDILSDI